MKGPTRDVTVDIKPGTAGAFHARRVLARAPEHVLRNGRRAGQGYLLAEVQAVHTWACGSEMRRYRKRDGAWTQSPCRCGADDLFKRWLQQDRWKGGA